MHFSPLHKHGRHSGGGCRRARAGQSRVMMSRDYRDVSSDTTAPRSALAVSPISEITAGCDDVIKRRAARQCGATDTLTSSIYALYHFLYHCQQQQQQNQSHHLHTEPNHFRLSLNWQNVLKATQRMTERGPQKKIVSQPVCNIEIVYIADWLVCMQTKTFLNVESSV